MKELKKYTSPSLIFSERQPKDALMADLSGDIIADYEDDNDLGWE